MANEVEFYVSKEARVYAEILRTEMERQACEMRLFCESWDFNEITSTWSFFFEGDLPKVVGAHNDPKENDYIVVLKNAIRGDYRMPGVTQKRSITMVCPLVHCTTNISLKVDVQTRKGLFPSGSKILPLFT